MPQPVNIASLQRPSKLSLPDLAYETIVEAIIDGRLSPGTRLSIDELARQLDMSNTPIREALSRIAAERLVSLHANRGYTVAPLLSESEYHQLFDVRHLLEIHALEVSNLQQTAIEQLVSAHERMLAASSGAHYREFNTFSRQDHAFHYALVRLSSNDFLIQAWTDLHFHLHVGRLYVGSGIVDYREAVQEHGAIIQALYSTDRAELIQRVSQHIKQAEARLKYLIQLREM